MASHRMFSQRLVSSARFLKMPKGAQLLYFHLGIQADDDGVVEAYPVINLVSASEEDLKELVNRGFVQILNDDLVTYITDWLENNNIRRDRKTDSLYKDLLLKVIPDVKILEGRPRAGSKNRTDNQWTTNGQPMAGINGQPMAGIGKDRLGKDRLCVAAATQAAAAPTIEAVKEYASAINATVDPEEFFSVMTARGWKIKTGDAVTDWRKHFDAWNRCEKERPANRNARPGEKHDYDFEAIETMLIEKQKEKTDAI